jgi:hypothetical protein
MTAAQTRQIVDTLTAWMTGSQPSLTLKGSGKHMASKREYERQTAQENALLTLGFTRTEAEQLRRISMTLHRWHELECGTDNYCISRGRMENGAFVYDDNGAPFYEFAGGSGRNRYSRIPDRETGAKKRLAAIIKARNARALAEADIVRPRPLGWRLTVSAYIQTDPRGAALYMTCPK